mgnify:CR=1 FL=1
MRILLAVLLCIATSAFAQQQDDPKIAHYRNLLTEANDRIVAIAAQATALEKALKEAQKECKPEPKAK